MRSNLKKRLLAMALCAAMVMGSGISVMAEGEPAPEEAGAEAMMLSEEEISQTEAAADNSSETLTTLAEEPMPEVTQEPTPEVTQEPTPEVTQEPTPEVTQEPTPEVTPELTPEITPEATPEPTPVPETASEPTPTPAPETESAESIKETTETAQTAEESDTETEPEEENVTENAQEVQKPEKIITLESKLDDMTVVLSGPESSFPEDTELSISVSEPAKEAEELIEEAVQKQAEEQQMAVRDYTALDIRLMSDGEEIQPLGPVQVVFEKPETETAAKSEEQIETKVFHVDEQTGDAEDMEAEQAEEGQVSIETTHFSIYVVVDLDQLGGQIDLTVQHWATVNQLDGVDGTDGLIESAGPNGKPGDATAALRSKDVFTNIYTDDVIKLDNKLNKNVEELSKVLLADANSEIKNYELKEIWVLKDNQTPGTSTIDKTDTDAYNTEKNKWTVYSLDNTDKTVKLTKNSTIRMIYEPVEASNALSQNVTFYDYDVTDGKRYDANGNPNPNGTFLNTTNQGINSEDNYKGGDTSNRLAVGMNSTWVDHSYHNAISGSGVVINWAGSGQADNAKKGIVNGINADGPIYNGVYAPQLFNNTPQIGKTVIDGYQLHFSQVGDTYTLSSVTNASGSTVLSNLETLIEIWDADKNLSRHIFSNNFWPLDNESHPNQDPLLGGATSFNSFNRNKVNSNEGDYKSTGESDDGRDHNWLFGMRYSFEFTLGDYTGPLNFYFRGDDDFWLFVDGTLQTDLGGIHSSVGANLDLKKCIDTNDRTATHKIDIIYAERGCFGSTCYMQFTLPNVKPVEFDTEIPKTTVTVNKVWEDHNNPNRPAFVDVELWYKANNDSTWTKYDTQTLNQANNWSYTWAGLPKTGYSYKVKEVGEEDGQFGNYKVNYSQEDGILSQSGDGSFSGTITNTANPSTRIVVNKVWDDGTLAKDARPDSVDFYLYYRQMGEEEWLQYPNGKLTLSSSDSDKWTGTYETLPVYGGDSNTLIEYTVMEIDGNHALEDGEMFQGKGIYKYTVDYPDGHFTNDGWKAYEAKANDVTLNLTVTNSLGIDIQVTKEWNGRAPENGTIIYAGLYKAGQPVADKWVELKAGNSWTATFQYLLPANDYSVKELRKAESGEAAEFTINNVGYVGVNSGSEASVGNGDTAIKYVVSYSQLTQDTTDSSLSNVTITNQAQWQLIKYSSSDEEKSKGLEGAEFELKHNTDNTIYKGVSYANGIVKWTKNNAEFTGVFPDGKYTLTETAAPTGYMLGDPVIFEMKDGVPKNMDGESAVIKDGILTFYYANEILYTLPSTGGPGIHWYIIGGMLLMTAGTLVLYKTRRRRGAEKIRK